MTQWNEDILRRAGFEKRADGGWHKIDLQDQHPANPANLEPNAQPSLHAAPSNAQLAVPRFLALITIFSVRARDNDGLNAKAYIDAITHGGQHWKDDSPEHLEVVFVPVRVRTKKEEKTEIEIFKL